MTMHKKSSSIRKLRLELQEITHQQKQARNGLTGEDMATSRNPPWIRTFSQDLKEVCLFLFCFFFGSLILWPIVIVISVTVIPVVYMIRYMCLVCAVSCRCGVRFYHCNCRQLAGPTESSWITEHDDVMDYSLYKAWHRKSKTNDAERQPLMNRPYSSPQSSVSLPNGLPAAVNNVPTIQDSTDVPSTAPETTNVTSQSLSNFAFSQTVSVHHLVLTVDKDISIDTLAKNIDTRLIKLCTAQGCRYFPRFTQCLVRVCGSLAWIEDPDFSLENHIEVHSQKLPSEEDLRKFLEQKMCEPLAKSRPLWQLVIASGYGTLEDIVLIWRFHASMYDGVTISKILTHTLSNPKLIRYKMPSQHQLYSGHVIKFLLYGPAMFLYLLYIGTKQKSQLGYNEQSNVQALWSERTLNLSQLLRNKMILSMTVNDILLAVLTGAFQKYDSELEEEKYHLSKITKVLLTTDTRGSVLKSKTLPQGNSLVLLPLKLPWRFRELVPRTWGAEYYQTKLKRSGRSLIQMYGIGWLHSLHLPNKLMQRVMTVLRQNCSTIVTSINGPSVLAPCDGNEVRDIMFFMCPSPGVSVTFNFITYSGTVKLSVMSRMSAGLDINKLVENMQSQLSDMNKMVFSRFFPDGVEEISGASANGVVSLSQPHITRIYTEFMDRLREIDANNSIRASPTIGRRYSEVRRGSPPIKPFSQLPSGSRSDADFTRTLSGRQGSSLSHSISPTSENLRPRRDSPARMPQLFSQLSQSASWSSEESASDESLPIRPPRRGKQTKKTTSEQIEMDSIPFADAEDGMETVLHGTSSEPVLSKETEITPSGQIISEEPTTVREEEPAVTAILAVNNPIDNSTVTTETVTSGESSDKAQHI